VFDERKADHRILNSALALQEEEPGRKVVMVTKDINLRLKAKALNLPAEDYETARSRTWATSTRAKASSTTCPRQVIHRAVRERVLQAGKRDEEKAFQEPLLHPQE
jgi:PhoH-like ATPase